MPNTEVHSENCPRCSMMFYKTIKTYFERNDSQSQTMQNKLTAVIILNINLHLMCLLLFIWVTSSTKIDVW
jgi:hypothetical protein